MSSILFFILLALIQSQVIASTEPDMVVEIFRHGARAPSNLKYDRSWPVQGELTPTGIRQHYVLGSALAKKYPNLLKEYSPREIFVRSSNFDRTIMSASAHLFGVFQGKGPKIPIEREGDFTLPPFADKTLLEEINSNLKNIAESVTSGFQPVVTQVVNKPEDRMLFVGPWNCAQMGIWQEERSKDSLNKEVYEYLEDTRTQLKILGHDINSMTDLLHFGDTLINNHHDNRELPKGVVYGSNLYNDAVFAYKWYSAHNYIGTGTERALKSLNLLSQIVEWFEGVVDRTHPIKFAFLSAHDTTLLPLLGLYNFTNATCLFENYKSEKLGKPVPYPECVFPVFASQMIYEFFNNSGEPYVKVLFNGSPLKVCNNDKFECSLKEFADQSRSLLAGYLPQDYNNLCDIPSPKVFQANNPTKGGSVFWYTFLIIVLFGVIAGLSYLLIMQRKQLQLQSEENGFYKAYDYELQEIVLVKNTTGL